jgi:hypothetical protein
MNSNFKLIPSLIGLATLSPALFAADVTTYPASPTYAPSTYSPSYSSSNSIATWSSNAVVLALNAQSLLLRDMAQEHLKRAADLTQNNQAEKAKWESDLVNELKEKIVRVQKNIDQAAQPSTGTNDLKTAVEVDDQLIFVSTVEARLEQLRQEVSAAIEDGRVLTVQMTTNKAPEDIASVSFALNENQKVVKQLQKEQADLDLRKLEFRALWKAMQK